MEVCRDIVEVTINVQLWLSGGISSHCWFIIVEQFDIARLCNLGSGH